MGRHSDDQARTDAPSRSAAAPLTDTTGDTDRAHLGADLGAGADQAPLPRRKLLVLTLGVIATLVAWGVLVVAAVDLGRQARAGASQAWVFVAVATLGAVVALFTMLLLGARVLSILQRREQPPAKPARMPGGRRAAR